MQMNDSLALMQPIPVVLNYAINVKPYRTSQGQIPAIGSAMAYIKAHIQEARGWDDYLPIQE